MTLMRMPICMDFKRWLDTFPGGSMIAVNGWLLELDYKVFILICLLSAIILHECPVFPRRNLIIDQLLG